MYKKILVAVDGSETSFKALNNAIALAKATQGELWILHVDSSTLEHQQHKRLGLVASEPEMSCELLVTRILDVMNAAEVKYTMHTDAGNPSEVIVTAAEKNNCDTIVMGCRGLGGFTKLFLGSVSSAVINKAEMPVVIVK